MSRHRFVRNIDIHGRFDYEIYGQTFPYVICSEELEDDAISDEGEDDLSPEDYGVWLQCVCEIRL